MSSFGIRPRFSQVLEMGIEETQARILREVPLASDRCEVKNFPGYICLRIPEPDRHFWSPRLTLSLEAEDKGKTRIEGIYGPNANVWALFLYGYLIIGSLAIFAGALGFAQWRTGASPWGLWVFGATLALAAGLHILAHAGRKLAAAQTSQLHHIYESSIGRDTRPR